MKEKYPYQLSQGDIIKVGEALKAVEGVEMLTQKVCKIHFVNDGFILMPFIKKLALLNRGTERTSRYEQRSSNA